MTLPGSSRPGGLTGEPLLPDGPPGMEGSLSSSPAGFSGPRGKIAFPGSRGRREDIQGGPGTTPRASAPLEPAAPGPPENELTLPETFDIVLKGYKGGLFDRLEIRGNRLIRIILALLLVILAATFSTLNREEIVLRYFFGWSTPPFPLFLLVLGSLAIGLVLGFSVDWGERWKLRSKARELQDRIHSLRREVESLTAAKTPPEPPPNPPEAPRTSPG